MDVDDLLQKTSRTFALAIPLLDEPTRRSVSLAYLVMRVIDTFEDASAWPKARRVEALQEVTSLLRGPAEGWTNGARRLVERARVRPWPTAHAGYLELLDQAHHVFDALGALPAAHRRVVSSVSATMASGMAGFVERADERGRLRLESPDELKAYCYVAAGLVGELLTELFLLDAPRLAGASAELRGTMVAFGEGLQLVNILKDARADADEGRLFLPGALPLDEVFAMARADLIEGGRYVRALQAHDAPRGMLAFPGICLLLAWRTLQALEAKRPKLSRLDVAAAMAALVDALDRQAPMQTLLD